MSALLDEPRIAYATRKVRRFRDDFEAWKAEYASRAEQGAWEDVIRDANRLAQDLFALDQLAPGVNPAAKNGHAHPVATEIAEWAATADQLAVTVAEKRGEVEGLKELRDHILTAHRLTAANPLEREFRELVRVWEADNYFISSTTKIVEHPAFKRIVELGDAVVPLLLAEVSRRPSHLVIALKRITGADPTTLEDRGKLRVMADAWVKWGKERNLI